MKELIHLLDKAKSSSGALPRSHKVRDQVMVLIENKSAIKRKSANQKTEECHLFWATFSQLPSASRSPVTSRSVKNKISCHFFCFTAFSIPQILVNASLQYISFLPSFSLSTLLTVSSILTSGFSAYSYFCLFVICFCSFAYYRLVFISNSRHFNMHVTCFLILFHELFVSVSIDDFFYLYYFYWFFFP